MALNLDENASSNVVNKKESKADYTVFFNNNTTRHVGHSKGSHRCKEWVVRCRREDLLNKNVDYLHRSCLLCADHFEPSQFMNAELRNKLIWNAVPSVFDVPNPPKPVAPKRRSLLRSITGPSSKKRVLAQKVSVASSKHDGQLVDHTYCAREDIPCVTGSLDIETCQAEPNSPVSSGMLRPIPGKNSTADTPLKKALKQKLKAERTRCYRLRRRLKCRPRPTKKQGSSIAGIDELKTCFTPAAFTLFNAQIRLRNKRARKWTNAERMVALALHYQSPKAYRFLKHIFRLPSATSLHRWVQHVKIEPGMNQHMIDLLALKVKKLSDRDRNCVLMLDEMAVKKGLRYCKMRDIVVGFDDDGKNRTSVLCSSVLVFMVRGMFSKWKQCICFTFTSNLLQADNVKTLLFDVLKQLASLKLLVRLVVSDQGSVFQKMFNGLGICESKPWLEFENQVICVMPDPPHLLKNVRNALYRYDIHHQGGIASWTDITTFVERDSQRKYRLAPKLTKKHIDLPPFSGMKVKLAAQVLSHSTSAAIETCIATGELPVAASGTAAFCKNANDLFDCFNSSTVTDAVYLRTALSDRSPHFDRLAELAKWLKSIKVIDRKTGKDVSFRFRCFDGWLQAIAALNKIWSMLKVVRGVSFLLTRKMNQDSLEHFFSIIRQRGGCRDNPTPFEFLHAFKQACINGLLVPAKTGNCNVEVDDLISVLLQPKSFDETAVSNLDDTLVSNDLTGDTSMLARSSQLVVKLPEDWISNSFAVLESNSLNYFTGYILRRLFAYHPGCISCSSAREVNTSTYSESQLLTFFKEYKSEPLHSSSISHLIVPAKDVSEVIQTCEAVFSYCIATKLHLPEVKQTIVSTLMETVKSSAGLCSTGLHFVLDLFVRCRIYFHLKYLDQKANEDRKRKNRKACKVMNV